VRVPPEANVSTDELRNRYGRDHGRDTPLRGLTGRHARLAVNSGTANCRFLFDTLAGPAAVADPVLDPGYVSAAVRNGVVAQGPCRVGTGDPNGLHGRRSCSVTSAR
jgi:hypothetical protein